MTPLHLESGRPLGRTGLIVNPLILGTMTFGNGGWRAGEETAAALFHHYREAGGWTFDTADVYGNGRAEEILGELVARSRCRDDVVLATKASAATAGRGGNSGGNGRKHLLAALEGSLQRLRTDYVDLFWIHLWDGVTPVADVVSTLDDIVRCGKARAVGLSNVPAWYAATAVSLARATQRHAPAALQLEYSLLERTCEVEHAPLAAATGLSLIAWGPLAGGLLSGKYNSGDTAMEGRLAPGADYPDRRDLSDRDRTLISRLVEVSSEAGSDPAKVALAWLLEQAAVDAVIIGATTVEQLAANLDPFGVTMSEHHRRALDVCTPDALRGSPYRLFRAG